MERSDSYDRIELDFPFEPKVRWGHGKPPHPELHALIDGRRESFAELLQTFVAMAPDLSVRDGDTPSWVNWYLGAIDVLALYGFVCHFRPTRYLEIGSGISTHVATRAIHDAGCPTEVVSIDPEPRADVDPIVTHVHRARLEDVDLTVFDDIDVGDIVFFDGSHRSFMNTDATVFFLEVLPRLPAGVFVHVHDIFLPEDYLPDWTDRHYNEQYLLAAWLLGGSKNVEVLFPSWFIHTDADLRKIAEPLWGKLGLQPDEYRGCSFWMKTTNVAG